jgi:hypothetical protein
MQISTFPIFLLSLGTRITYISQNTTIIRLLTNLKKRSNLDSLYFLFFWYEFPYLFFRWTTKKMQLLVRDMDDLMICLELMRWVSASRIWFYKRNVTVKHLSVFAKLHLSSPYRVVRDFLNVRVNQNSQVTDASVRKMEYCAIVGTIALNRVINNEF